MPILQAMDGKYYDVPDAEAAAFEVPREKVKELLQKSGMPAPQSAQSGPPPGASRGGPGPGPQGSGGGGGGAPGPVVVQIFASPQGGYQGAPQGGGPSHGAPAPSGGQDGDVDPYWFWRNVSGGGRWWNTWGNW